MNKSKNDTKQLFNLINNITMSKTASPMPEGKMDAQLGEEFASFFLDKIEKIRVQFQDIDEYIPEVSMSVPMFQHLSPDTNEEIEWWILNMKPVNWT